MRDEDPRHGTVAGYNRIPCREECCRRAHANYRKRLEWDNLNGRPRIVTTLGVRRRIQALNRLGWSNARIAQHAGMHPTNMTRLIYGDTMTRALRDRLCATYEALSMKLPTGNPQAIANVRNRAERNGWPPPLAWDDIDDPAVSSEAVENVCQSLNPNRTQVDEVLVIRVLQGDSTIAKAASPAERSVITQRWQASGRSVNDLARLTGWKPERYFKASA